MVVNSIQMAFQLKTTYEPPHKTLEGRSEYRFAVGSLLETEKPYTILPLDVEIHLVPISNK
jgi:hypothetical protein